MSIEGRLGPDAIVLLFEDRQEAESIAAEICSRGTPVVVRPHPVSRPGFSL